MDETNAIPTTVLAMDGVTEQAAVMPPADTRPLEDRRRELIARKNEIDASIHDLDAQIDAAVGDEDGAAWHRAEARYSRSGSGEDRASAHQAWRFMMARRHLKSGTTPPADSYLPDEVIAEMERLKAAKV